MIEHKELMSVLYALALAFVGVFAGYKTNKYAFRQSFNRAIGIALGGMAARLLLNVIIIGLILALLDVNAMYFGITYCVAYFLLLMVEIVHINSYYNKLKKEHLQQIKQQKQEQNR